MTVEAKYRHEGRQIEFVALGGEAVGDVVEVNGFAGIVLSVPKQAATATVGDVLSVAVEGVFEIPKKSGFAPAQGAIVDWDTGNSEAVPDGDAASDFEAGKAVKAAAGGDATVLVKLTW